MTGGQASRAAVEPSRVARVAVHDTRQGNYALGTGYRISHRLVLTAAHVVEGDGDVLVSLGDDVEWSGAERVWEDPEVDVALLRLEPTPDTTVTPVHLGRVDGTAAGRVTADALGYPVHALVVDDLTGDRYRGRQHVRCRVVTAARGRPKTLRLELDSTPAPYAGGDSPWRGMSGAAVVTRDSGLLVGVFREHVPAMGVSAHDVTDLAAIDDTRWRELLDEEGVHPEPRLAPPDGWDTTGGRLVLHHQHMAALAGHESVFTRHALPFVDPAPGHPAAPENILRRLGEFADDVQAPLGVVLTGPAGTGKSRICLETARLADREGWLVVHLDDVPLDAAWSCVHPLARRILLVVEDVASLSELSRRVADRLCWAADDKNVELAVMVAARTTAWRLHQTRLRPFFQRIEAPDDSAYYAGVRRAAVRALAGPAVRQIGERRTMRLCGGPPAIALHLAHLRGLQASRGQDLRRAVPLDARRVTVWMGDVLDAEGLAGPGVRTAADQWEDEPPPSALLMDSARVAAATPCASRELAGVLGEDTAEKCVNGLRLRGLLEERGGEVHMVHGLFTDQLLARAVLMGDEETVRHEALGTVLDTGLARPQLFGNVLRSVSRLHDALGESRSEMLAEAVGQWFGEADGARSARAGELIATDPRGRALLTLLRGRPWRHLAQRYPQQMVEPWLRAHYRDSAARHALVAVRSHLDASHSMAYLMGWIDKNAVLPEAAYVFHHAVPAADADPAFTEWTVDGMYEYLTRNWDRPEASRVYDRLLDSAKGLALSEGDPRVAQVIDWALTWLRRHPTRTEAGYFAPQLVLRPELTGRRLATTAQYLLDTVIPRARGNASYSLEPLLKRHRLRRDLPHPVFKQTVKDALAWLEDGNLGLLPEAAYVLGELLRRELPGRDDAPRAAQCALNWLETRATHPDAWRVLAPLLTKVRKPATRAEAMLTDDECAELASHAVSWLREPGAEPRNKISLLGALLRTRLFDGDDEELPRLAGQALELLRRSPVPTAARALLPPLLAKNSLPAQDREAVLEATFGYLRHHPRSEHTSFPLTVLVSRQDLTEQQFQDVMTATLDWIDAHPRQTSAFRLLSGALNSPLAGPAERSRLAGRVIELLSAELLATDAQHRLTKRLLAHRDEIVPEWNRFVARAGQVLAAAGFPPSGLTVLRPMLEGADRLDQPTRDALFATCAAWCEVRPLSSTALALLRTVLTSRPLSATARRTVSAVGCRMLSPDTVRKREGGGLLLELLRQGDLAAIPAAEADGGTPIEKVVRVSLDWLDAWPEDARATALLQQVTHRLRHKGGTPTRPRPGLPGGTDEPSAAHMAERAIRHWENWPAAHPSATREERAAAEEHLRYLRSAVRGPGG
ncbi:trypsin-like peptidase domain-containing protein [Streptomyces sp. NPDC090057]|uniref:trypsin-like peptidase domain-containing protein n=1 Tax=Streptomyces sp. NPDC090057 TaxID=3365935 RepID=UPI003811707B